MAPKKDTQHELFLQQDPSYLPPSARNYDNDMDCKILELAHEHGVFVSVSGPASMTAKDEKWAPVVQELNTLYRQRQKELCIQYLEELEQWKGGMNSRAINLRCHREVFLQHSVLQLRF